MIFTISGLDVGVQFDWSIGGFTCHGQVLLILWVVSSILLVPSLVYYYAQRRSAPLWVGQPIYAQPKKRLPISLVRLLREEKKSFEVILEGDFFAWYLVGLQRGIEEVQCAKNMMLLVAFQRNNFIEEVRAIVKDIHELNVSRNNAYFLHSGIYISDYLYLTHLDLRVTSLLERHPSALKCILNDECWNEPEYKVRFIPLVLLDRRLVGGLGVGGYRAQPEWLLKDISSTEKLGKTDVRKRPSFLIPVKFARWLPEDYQSVLFTGYQDFLSAVYESLVSIVKGQLGERGYRPWVSYIGTVFLFIFVSNWVGGLLPWSLISLPRGGISAPTGDINVVVALSVLTSMSYFYAGLKARGLGFFGRYVLPGIGFLPLNVLEEFSKPLSLSFRLFGNVLADEIVGCVLCSVFGLFIPLPVMVLGIFSGSVQALVFATLTAAYVADAFE